MAKESTPKAPARSANKSGSSPVSRARQAVRSGAPADAGPRAAQRASLLSFFRESRTELRKVTWPTRQETLNLTGAVIAMTVGMAAFLGLVDKIFDSIISPLIGAK